MRKYFLFSILALIVVAGCSKDPKSYTIAEWDAMSQNDKKEKMRELNGEETAYLMRGMMRKAFSGEKFDSSKTTVGDLIEEGKKADSSAK